jgi:hypothetical protein
MYNPSLKPLNDNIFKIVINEFFYKVYSIDSFHNIKKNIFEKVSKNLYPNDNITIKYKITFYINDTIDFEIYIHNREYIVDLIDDINMNNLTISLNKTKIS